MDPYTCPICGWKTKRRELVGYVALCWHVWRRHMDKKSNPDIRWCWCGLPVHQPFRHFKDHGDLHKHYFDHLMGVADEG